MSSSVRISPQLEQEIESKTRTLDGEACIDYLLDVQRMLRDTCDKASVHMSDYLGAIGDDRPRAAPAGKRTARGKVSTKPPSRKRTRCGKLTVIEVPQDVVTLTMSGHVEAQDDEFTCPNCGAECCMDYATSDMVCTGCGICTFVYGQSADNVTFDQHSSMNRTPGAAYLRTNHLNELLCQVQGRETKHIPDTVLDGVRGELRKMRLTDMDQVEFSQVDDILHRLGLTSYYDHTVTITSLVTGREVSAMSPETEAQIQDMFMQVQRPWLLHKPEDRTNFLCYRYVLHQLCRLLDLDDFLPRFRLLKSPARNADLDKVWKLICRDLGWDFYPVA